MHVLTNFINYPMSSFIIISMGKTEVKQLIIDEIINSFSQIIKIKGLYSNLV